MDEERLYWLAFSAFKGIGAKRFALLKNFFGSAKKAWGAPFSEWRAIGLAESLCRQLVDFKKEFDPEAYFKKLEKSGVGCLFLDGRDYPSNLRKIDDPPFVLYVWGKIKEEDEKALAVVGTRKMTAYGGQSAESLTAELVGAGLTIVSGLARGIDSMAHKTALAAGGRTIAVLGSSVDWIYPWENKGLAKRIADSGGAVVSEYPLGTKPMLGYFPARNRIISGLTLGALVVEGGEKSGSLITARLATEQGREVFAVPGPIYSPGSRAPAHLIKLGAKLVSSVEDILEELGLEAKKRPGEEVGAESGEEELILSLIEQEPKHIDQIVRESGLTTGEVTSLMTMMEIKGLARDLGNMVYFKDNKR
jgi:DNA processing protein